MRLAVSNIGWTAAEDESALPRLRDAGVEAIEVAPGRVFPDALTATVADAAAVGHPGVGQVVDTGNMMMEEEPPEAIRAVAPHIRHPHISASQLGPVADRADFVGQVIPVVRDLGYNGVVTVEMRLGEGDDPMVELLRAAELLRGLIDGG